MKKIQLVLQLLSIISMASLVTPAPVDNGVVKQVGKNVYAFKHIQGLVLNSMFIVTSKGVIVIEPFNSIHARKLIKAIRTITPKPIKYLLISHNHWDHARGGKVFSDEGATVIAHQEAVDWMEEHPSDDLYLPDRTWRGRKQTLCLGEARVDLNYYGINHGYGMTVFVYKPPNGSTKDNVAYIADLVTPNRVLFASIPDSNMQEAISTYHKIVQLPFDRIVFSHGPLLDSPPDGTIQDVRNTLQYSVDLDAAVKQAFKDGKNLIVDPGLLDLPQYKHLAFYEKDFTKNVEKFAFELFIGPYPWRSVRRYLKPSKIAFPLRRVKRRNNQ